MPSVPQDQLFTIFIVIWVILGIGSAAFFFFINDATLKRKVWTPFTIGASALFLGFIWLMGFPSHVMYVAVPFVALITVLNLRAVRFCDSCGKTLMNQNPFSKPSFCSRCGAKLGQ
ncbi:MAG: hypothetical protein JNK40_09580 [Chromatiales bacterium]|nr:hypothetical protein [Chromatiales bacterium]